MQSRPTIGAQRPAFFALVAARIEGLADHPRLGPRRTDIRPDARMLVAGRYLVLYETHPDTDEGPLDAVEIVRVIDGRRDLPSLF